MFVRCDLHLPLVGPSLPLLLRARPPSPSRLPALRSVPSPFRVFVRRSTPPMVSAQVVAEYAKSGRSSCKACGKSISPGSLRLGLSAEDARGFQIIRWHHLDCFPASARPFATAREIEGYSLLESSDREALTEILVSATQSVDEDGGEEKDKGKKRKKIVVEGAKTEEDTGIILKKLSPVGKKGGAEELAFHISDIRSSYKNASLPPKWRAFRTVIYREADDGHRDSDKIAAFDFDGCLVNTSVKKVGPDAWSLLYPSIPQKLRNLYDDGYKLVIFTNESNIERWKNKRQLAIDSKLGRLENFLKCVNVPMQVFIACGLGKGNNQMDDPFRKPNPGMWRLLEKHFNSGIAIDMDRSFFVGDAAGRINDHSDADKRFAENVGLKFHLPEDFFGA